MVLAWDNLSQSEGLILDYRSATWSSRGDKVAFVSCERFADRPIGVCNTVFVLQVYDSGLLTMTNSPDDFAYAPSWAPDGNEFVVVSSHDGNDEIYRQNVSSDLIRLTNNPGWDSMPSWSPNGNEIVFVSAQDDDCCELYAMDRTGSNTRQLTQSTTLKLLPSWSPSGDEIAFFEANRGWSYGDSILFEYDLPISKVTILNVSDSRFRSFRLGTQVYLNANTKLAWSPDANKVAFTSWMTATQAAIHIIDTSDGSQLLVDTVINPSNLVWSPNGHRIAYSDRDGLFVLSISAPTPVQLSEHQGLTPYWVSDNEIQYFQTSTELTRMVWILKTQDIRPSGDFVIYQVGDQ